VPSLTVMWNDFIHINVPSTLDEIYPKQRLLVSDSYEKSGSSQREGPGDERPAVDGPKTQHDAGEGYIVSQNTTTSCRRYRVPSRIAPSAPLSDSQGVFALCVNRCGGCAMSS
jgi:hypothetical protein